MRTSIAVNGACGRMGQRLVALSQEDPELALVAALDSPKNSHQGRDAGEIAGIGKLGVAVKQAIPPDLAVDVVIDFSAPAGTMAVLPVCVERKIPLVVATTGHTPEQKIQIEAAAHETAILFSANMSLVVNVLFKLVADTAGLLAGKGFDVEVVERHHRFKKDAPSGTAMHFVKIIQDVMKQSRIQHGREGILGERPADEIGVHSIRAGDNVGEHTIVFSALGETLELVHKGYSRDSYARGALLAAKFLAGKGAERYTMKDVLGL